MHAYGDVYSSPGLSLRQKQLLTSAFLVRAWPWFAMDSLAAFLHACCEWTPADHFAPSDAVVTR